VTQPNDPRKVKVILELIDHTSRIAGAHERNDLADRLAVARERINDPQIRVVIAGQLKQGKSQLVNSLLNMPVARVGDDESTVLPTFVSHGDPASASERAAWARLPPVRCAKRSHLAVSRSNAATAKPLRSKLSARSKSRLRQLHAR